MRILIVKQILLVSILGNSLRAVGRISVLILCGNGVIRVYSVTLSDQILEGIEGGTLAFPLLFARPREHVLIALRLKLKEGLWIEVYEKFSSANIFFKHIRLRKSFFSDIIFVQTIFFPVFSVFFLFVLNITIVLLNYFTKNVINSAIATYFVDVHPNHLSGS